MKIKTALILCAGFGKRLNPITLKNPKPLLRINNITLLENTINLIKKLGIKKILINTFYQKDEIKFFLNKNNFDVSIEIVEDGNQILNTGGGIANLIQNSNEKDFLVFNPDTVWNINYHNCIEEMDRIYQSNDIKSIFSSRQSNLDNASFISDFNFVASVISSGDGEVSGILYA